MLLVYSTDTVLARLINETDSWELISMMKLYKRLWKSRENLLQFVTQPPKSFVSDGVEQEDVVMVDASARSDNENSEDGNNLVGKIVCLSDIFGPLPPLPQYFARNFYVRKEYHDFDKFIDEERGKDEESEREYVPLLLCGQPGIGALSFDD